MTFRRLTRADTDDAARVVRVSFDTALPTLAGLHTPEEDREYWAQLLEKCEIWGAFGTSGMIGVVAFRPDWIDQLYILPEAQGRGIGTDLLKIAQRSFNHLQAWTFQRNLSARRFYESHGFVAVKQTDGHENEEKEPDVLYEWHHALADE